MASVKSSPRNGANADNTVTPQPGGQLRTTGAMTERQRRFAAKNHNLIYRYLHEKGWEISEYYDIAAFGYLRAVRRYASRSSRSTKPRRSGRRGHRPDVCVKSRRLRWNLSRHQQSAASHCAQSTGPLMGGK